MRFSTFLLLLVLFCAKVATALDTDQLGTVEIDTNHEPGNKEIRSSRRLKGSGKTFKKQENDAKDEERGLLGNLKGIFQRNPDLAKLKSLSSKDADVNEIKTFVKNSPQLTRLKTMVEKDPELNKLVPALAKNQGKISVGQFKSLVIKMGGGKAKAKWFAALLSLLMLGMIGAYIGLAHHVYGPPK